MNEICCLLHAFGSRYGITDRISAGESRAAGGLSVLLPACHLVSVSQTTMCYAGLSRGAYLGRLSLIEQVPVGCQVSAMITACFFPLAGLLHTTSIPNLQTPAFSVIPWWNYLTRSAQPSKKTSPLCRRNGSKRSPLCPLG